MVRVIATIGLIQVLGILIGLVRAKVVAVLGGPEGVGIISTLGQIVQTAAHFSALSLPFAAIKFLSRSHSQSQTAFKNCYASFLRILLVLSFAGTAVIIALLIFRPNILGAEIFRYKGLLSIAILSLPAMVLSGFLVNVLAAAQKSRQSAMVAVVTALAVTIASCLGIWLDGIRGFYIGNTLANFLVIAGLIVYLRENLGLPFYERGVSIIEEFRRSPDIIPFAVLQYFSTLMYSCSFLVARYTVLVSHGETTAGLLQSVLGIPLAIGAVLNPANGLYLTPIMNRDIDPREKMRAALEFQKKLMLIQAAISVPIVLFPGLILTILYSAEFAVAAQFIFLFILWQALTQLAGVNQALMIGLDDVKAYTVITGVSYFVALLFCWLSVPKYGINGVAAGFCISSALIYLLSWARLKKNHGYSVPTQSIVLISYSLALMALIGLITIRLGQFTALNFAFRLGIFACFILSLLFFFSREEKDSLYGMLGQFNPWKA